MGQPPCPRCYSEDEVLRPWPGFRVARVVWLSGLGLIGVLSPILFSDLVVMIPMTVCFLFAGGPVLEYAKQTPTCRDCGLSRPHPGWHETPCRPVRGLESALEVSALRRRATVWGGDDEQSGVRPLPTPPAPAPTPPTAEGAPS